MRNRLVVTNIVIKTFGGFALSQKTTKKTNCTTRARPKLFQSCDWLKGYRGIQKNWCDTRPGVGSRAACVYVQRDVSVRRICLQLKMTERTDQRIFIKYCFNLGKSCTETIKMIQKAFVDEIMGVTQIKEWYRRFKNGRTPSNLNYRNLHRINR